MSVRTDKFDEELKKLLEFGNELKNAILFDCHPEEVRRQVLEQEDGIEEKADKFLEELPDFRSKYQIWHSQAQAVVKQILPDRLTDFNSYYEYLKPRKSLSHDNYRIRDYLHGTVRRDYAEQIIVGGAAAVPCFGQQMIILRAARTALKSKLMDLSAILQADLYDSEIETAVALQKAGYLRASGAICGVVIEKHLQHLCKLHSVNVRKKSPSISDLNQHLRDNDVLSIPDWRFIQHLADIRNICDHAKGREPTNDEIEGLTSGTARVLKTMF